MFKKAIELQNYYNGESKLTIQDNEYGLQIVDESVYDEQRMYECIFIHHENIEDFFKLMDEYREFLKNGN